MNDDHKQNDPTQETTSNTTNQEIASSANDENTAGTQAKTYSADEYNELKNKLDQMTTLCQQTLADLQNFRRRSEEEKSGFIQFANAEIIRDLIPAIDNIDRALQHEPKDEQWLKGVQQMFKLFPKFLEKHGVKPIESLNKPFDPKFHEALITGPGEKDTVIEEYEKGYMLFDRVLKMARVKVGNGENIEEQEKTNQNS